MTTQQTIDRLKEAAITGAARDIEEIRKLAHGVFFPSDVMERYGLPIEIVIDIIAPVLPKPTFTRPRRHSKGGSDV